MEEDIIAIDDPRAPDVQALLGSHLRYAHEHTPPDDVHALDVDGLLDPPLTFYGLRRQGELLGIGAIKRLDRDHVELKSMHTAEAARGQGVGRAMLEHLLEVAEAQGAQRVSLETGSSEAFEAARSLYAAAGFAPCGPFGDYMATSTNTFMTLILTEREPCR